MALLTSRRSLLMGAAGLTALAAGCSQQTMQSEDAAEAMGAFPGLPGGADLLGPKAGAARLYNNENPYGPAPSALRGAEYAAKQGSYYNNRELSQALAAQIASRHGLDTGNIVLSAGSGEALSAVAMIYGRRGPIVAPRLFFDATTLYAQRLGLATIERVPMDADINVDLVALEARVTTDTGMVHLCNPNNPTGVLLEPEALKAAVRRMAAKTTVVIDEAYMELTNDPEGNSCIDLVREGHNVIVTRTFSKIYGMAGLRVGYVLAQPETAKEINSAKMSWMGGTGLAAALASYEDQRFLDESLAKIVEGREMINETLATLEILTLPSQTNFIYFKSGTDANTLREQLAARNIHIRGQYMDYDEWSRVSTGLLPDVERFCKALPEIRGQFT